MASASQRAYRPSGHPWDSTNLTHYVDHRLASRTGLWLLMLLG